MATNIDPSRVLIFDATLRNTTPALGRRMTLGEKLRIARALCELGVDVIEAGFPAASRTDFKSVQAVAREVEGPVISALARCTRSDIERSAEALREATLRRLHVFIPTSPIHRHHTLKMTKDEILRRAVEGVQIAREHCDDVEFTPEDAARTEPEFLAEVVSAVVAAGAGTVNIPDSAGYSVPEEFGQLFRYLRQHASGIDKAVLSVHCHDDLGMAVANSLTAVLAGARQVECTINGVGERAGNCSTEEIVMAMKTREGYFRVRTGIDPARLYPVSRLVSSITGIPLPRSKVIAGESATAVELGLQWHKLQ